MARQFAFAARELESFADDSLAVWQQREQLMETIRAIHRNGWAPGTGGNFSVLLSDDPLRLLMSPSGVDKGEIKAADLLIVNEHGKKLEGEGNPSAETLLHLAIVKRTNARAILHTHSIWNTLLSDLHGESGQLTVSGYEMLKGLEGVKTHEHHERIPILKNSQEIPQLAAEVETLLDGDTSVHGFLLERHGLYTWGNDLAAARRHVEVFEFLFEVIGRKLSLQGRS